MIGLLTQKVISLFLVMICGFAIVRLKFLKPADSFTLSQISKYLFLPCSVFVSFQIECSTSTVGGIKLSFVAAILINLFLIAAFTALRKVLKLNSIELASVIYSNAGAITIPIVLSVLGEEWLVYTCGFIVIQTILVWSHCNTILSERPKFSFRASFLNFNMVCIYLGAVIFFLNIKIPFILKDTMSTFTTMSGPTGMLVLGMIIAGTDLRKALINKRIWFVVFLRLIVAPVMVIALLSVLKLSSALPNGKDVLLVSVLSTITPSALSIPALAQLNGNDADYASQINVLSNVCCIITIPMMLWLFERIC